MPSSTRTTVAVLVTLLAGAGAVRPQSLREAARLDAAGKCAEAEKIYEAALARGRASEALLNNTANHHVVCGDAEKARSYFEKLLAINSAHPNANFQLARMAAERKDGARALEHLERLKTSDPQVELVRAEALHWSGQSRGAIAILESVREAAAADARLLYLLGVTAARMEQYDHAEAAFQRALTLQPGDFDIMLALGRAAARAEHYQRAQSALEAAHKIRLGDTDVLVELGRTAAGRQDYVRSVYYLARARHNAPQDPGILLLLARAAEDAGYYDDAASAYDDYLRVRPGDDPVRRDRARAYGQTDSGFERAVKEIDAYLARHPEDAQGHYIAAQILWGVKPEQALHHLTAGVRLDPDSVSIRFSRAWMLQRAGQMAESLPDLEAARRLAPGNARILDLMALAYLALDRPADAERVLRAALAQAPDQPEVLMHLGRALMALGREAEAQTYLEKYRALRPQALPGLRKRTGMIELATLPASEQRRREIERFRREAKDHPDRPDYQLHLASLLLADGRKDEALREFSLLQSRNADARILHEAGTILLSAGHDSRAQEFLEAAAKERPAALLELAIAVFQTAGAAPALEILARVPEGDLASQALLLKASMLESAGRRAEAESVLAEGLRQSAASPAVAQRAVPLLVRVGRTGEALSLLDKALTADAENPGLLLSKALVLAISGKSDAAARSLRNLESRWPEWDRPYVAHALLLERLGRLSEARQRLRTAEALGAQDAATNCGLSRTAGAAEAANCACARSLEHLLFNGCSR